MLQAVGHDAVSLMSAAAALGGAALHGVFGPPLEALWAFFAAALGLMLPLYKACTCPDVGLQIFVLA